ncbi:phospholipase C [Neobacillus cucumis]|uniref:phospholipase C n=1 Tax=Neobacillus cucumis TaxID=1740721 RepID=UPI0019666699|nr:alkaline phosphatase family protein [Neobacillus cucumis]MBM7655908.1 phospholipase C [Neobacillus cucumis]
MKKFGKLALSFGALTILTAAPLMAAENQAVKTSANSTIPYNVLNDKSTKTTTPIKHVVVIFQENVSFDHYFGTYPSAQNPKGEPQFNAAKNTPTVNGLSGGLLTNNPNGANPQRLDRSQAVTADMDHSYTNEQRATDGGKMDQFVQYGGKGSDLVMDYYDGNTVTAMWNYAQAYALNDNSFGTGYGPSTPGALNLISGQTHGSTTYTANIAKGGTVSTSQPTNRTITADPNPYYDKDSSGSTAAMDDTNKNVGDLLNAKNITWGWFQGGFRKSDEQHKNIAGGTSTDYSPHHEPFQYYKSTSNPNHVAPSSSDMIGKTDQANHQYDLTDFWTAANSGNLPAVSFLKAPEYQDGHAGYSDPLDEQTFLTNTINKLQQLPEWKDTAVVIAYDDSDGWYDHVMAPLMNGSNDPQLDMLNGQGDAGTPKVGTYLDRAGYGPRLPLLVISPYAKQNFVDNTLTDQTSILRFIEDNWNLGRIGDSSMDELAGTMNNMFDFTNDGNNNQLFLNPSTGEKESKESAAKQSKEYLATLYKDAGVDAPEK